MAVIKETIYLKADKNVEVQKREVTLGDIVSLECSDKTLIPKLKTLKLFVIEEKGKHRYVISILKMIACIHEKYPMLDIQNMGEKDVIVTYEDQEPSNPFLQACKTTLVMVITFLGAAFSIMAFNNDVSTARLFSQIYELLVGEPSDGFTILELTYCIGLAIGILVFFNHFGKKRFSVDPTPMEVEMRLYENDIQTTLIDTYSRKEQELDVGKTGSAGNHRS